MNDSRPLALHIAPTPFFADRGCHIRIEGIVRSLESNNWNSVVCTYHHGRDIHAIDTVRIGNIAAYTQTEAGPNPWKLWADLKLLWICIRETNRKRPQIIHAHLHEGLFIGCLIKLVFFWRRLPLLADLQGSFTGELESHGVFKRWRWLKAFLRFCEKSLLWFPDHIVCSSQRSLTMLREQFGVAEDRCSLAQDGANGAHSPSENDKAKHRKALGIPNEAIVVVYSGALQRAKGLNELQQLILATTQLKNIRFVVVGYPVEELSEFINEHTLNSQVALLGRVPFEKLQNILAIADIAVDPKNFDAGEGSGKMLNYLASGLPVLAFNTENNRHFLPAASPLADSVEQMREQLAHWALDADARNNAGKTNQAHFAEHYSWQVTQAQLQIVYSKLTQV